ncbi:unnamed protein product [Adineta steineri]|uniref:Uncharacterized protein n=1 Tax=Adineta steineri TaxID=433720 RepID=A0A815P822_9BILA|nr:unnamed protein product [Adineta steineri]
MLKVEYPCRTISSSYEDLNKPIITASQAKKHLHDIRLQRQNQLTANINECHRLQAIHKQLFNHQLNSSSSSSSSSIEKCPDKKLINNDYVSYVNKYSIPRIKYASIIYRQAIPTFELDPLVESKNDTPIIKELTHYLSELPCTSSNERIRKNNRSFSSIKHDRERSLSVSSVSSTDKRANKVYEKWPDYNQISEIVGYRINPPSSKLITSKTILSRPSNTNNQQKRTTSNKLPTVSKQKKTSSRTIQQKSSKSIIPSTTIEKPLSPELPPPPQPVKEVQPILPNLLCPSSLTYSHRIRTRQWLIKHNFSSNTIRTLPLL